MNKPLLVGITGGIGAGKSTIAKIFSILGIHIYDSDSRAKDLMVESDNIKSALRVLFGDESFVDGHLNRQLIAQKSFNEPKLLTQLNELVHPIVSEDFKTWVQSHSSEKYLIKEAALLFETGSYKQLDKVLLVTAPEDTRIKRVVSRDSHRTEEDVRAIMAKQLPEEEKEALADVVLRNDDSGLMIPQVLKLHEQFSKQQVLSQ
ncbi:MAG: dephospho-CoA kinase [Cyclobacteriaceae bacterium]